MLAALLCNLQPGPPPPPAQPAKHFGGGPFWRKYGYDDEEDLSSVAQEARAALPGAKAEKAEAAIARVRKAAAASFMAGPNAVDVVRVADVLAALDGPKED